VLEKAKKFLTGVAKTAAVEVLRGYVAKRIKAIQVDDIIAAIEADDTDLIGKLSDKDKKILVVAARRFSEYLDLLTVKNVMLWLVEDAPLHAGVIYGHPKGLKWLEGVLKQIRERAQTYVQAPGAELELDPVSSTKTISTNT